MIDLAKDKAVGPTSLLVVVFVPCMLAVVAMAACSQATSSVNLFLPPYGRSAPRLLGRS